MVYCRLPHPSALVESSLSPVLLVLVPGMGVVSKVGPGVTAFKEGQRVTSLGWLTTKEGNGSWQQFITLPQELLVPLPDSISDEAGAQFYVSHSRQAKRGPSGVAFQTVMPLTCILPADVLS